MRVVFAGSPEAAVPTVRTLAQGPHEVVGVVTREDSPQGRRRVLTPTPVATLAHELGIPLIRANRLDDAVTARIAELNADLGVIVAYGGLVREPLLSLPRHGWINLHFSLLPRWRGAAPVQRAIIAGDELTGATVFRLVEELDAGDVYGRLTRALTGHETAGELLEELAHSGAELTARVVDAIAAGAARGEPQEGDVTHAPKLTIDDARLDFARPCHEVYARVRGVTPEPGAFAIVDGDRLKLHAARPAPESAPRAPGVIELDGDRVVVGTADVPLELLEVQPAGKRRMPAREWWRGLGAQRAVAA